MSGGSWVGVLIVLLIVAACLAVLALWPEKPVRQFLGELDEDEP